MKRQVKTSLVGAVAVMLLLAGCSSDDGNGNGNGNGNDGNGDNGSSSEGAALAEEMRSWDFCEMLDNLQGIRDYMGIIDFGAGAEPVNSPYDEGWDPQAVECFGLIGLGHLESGSVTVSHSGELKVKLVPYENEDDAIFAYNDRADKISTTGDNSSDDDWGELDRTDLGDPWDEGVISDSRSDIYEYVELVARDGQWVFHIDLYYSYDKGLDSGLAQFYPFTEEELQQWFAESYATEVNQIVNDRIADGAGS